MWAIYSPHPSQLTSAAQPRLQPTLIYKRGLEARLSFGCWCSTGLHDSRWNWWRVLYCGILFLQRGRLCDALQRCWCFTFLRCSVRDNMDNPSYGSPVCQDLFRMNSHLLIPDLGIAPAGFHDVVIENLAATPTWRSRHLHPGDVTSLCRRWPKALFRTMPKRLMNMERRSRHSRNRPNFDSIGRAFVPCVRNRSRLPWTYI